MKTKIFMEKENLHRRLNKLLDEKSEKENKRYYVKDVARIFPELTYETVRKWFAGEAEIGRNEYLVKLSEYFGVSIDYLLKGEESEPSTFTPEEEALLNDPQYKKIFYDLDKFDDDVKSDILLTIRAIIDAHKKKTE